MAVNTKKVSGRRAVRYESLDELLADAERIAKSDVETLGNWSPGQVYAHLAKTMNCSIDGFDFSMPAPVRLMLTLFMKRKFFKKEIPAGFKSTASFIPDQTTAEEGLKALQDSIVRLQNESKRAPHPGFGKISRDDWNDFHKRHAEMHMSFLVDRDATVV